MYKSFVITEQDRQRILNTHKLATQKHYLGEQAGAPIKPTNTTATNPPSTPTSNPTNTTATSTQQTGGNSITDLQNLLLAKGYSVGDKGADGKFGNDTAKAVMSALENVVSKDNNSASQNDANKDKNLPV